MPKQAIVQSSIEAIEIVESPIPIPKDDEIVIKVVVCGTNPKDWKYPVWSVTSFCGGKIRLEDNTVLYALC
jgi:NADPH:quinone reductase